MPTRLLGTLVIHYWGACMCMPFGRNGRWQKNLFSIEQFTSVLQKICCDVVALILHWDKMQSRKCDQEKIFHAWGPSTASASHCVAYWRDKWKQVDDNSLKFLIFYTATFYNTIFDFSPLELCVFNDTTYLKISSEESSDESCRRQDIQPLLLLTQKMQTWEKGLCWNHGNLSSVLCLRLWNKIV